jgi:hypothetical protein
MFLALMEIRAPWPYQFNGLEGLGTNQVRKAPVLPVTHHRQMTLARDRAIERRFKLD